MLPVGAVCNCAANTAYGLTDVSRSQEAKLHKIIHSPQKSLHVIAAQESASNNEYRHKQ